VAAVRAHERTPFRCPKKPSRCSGQCAYCWFDAFRPTGKQSDANKRDFAASTCVRKRILGFVLHGDADASENPGRDQRERRVVQPNENHTYAFGYSGSGANNQRLRLKLDSPSCEKGSIWKDGKLKHGECRYPETRELMRCFRCPFGSEIERSAEVMRYPEREKRVGIDGSRYELAEAVNVSLRTCRDGD
jgi:hypothetical protein